MADKLMPHEIAERLRVLASATHNVVDCEALREAASAVEMVEDIRKESAAEPASGRAYARGYNRGRVTGSQGWKSMVAFGRRDARRKLIEYLKSLPEDGHD